MSPGYIPPGLGSSKECRKSRSHLLYAEEHMIPATRILLQGGVESENLVTLQAHLFLLN